MDRLSAVTGNKDMFETFWLGGDVGKTPISFNWWPESRSRIPTGRLIESDDLDYSVQMEGVEGLAQVLPSLEGVYVPCIRPYFGITLIAEGFGAKVEVPEWDCPWVRTRPVATIEQAAGLTVEGFLASPVVERVLKRLRMMVERAPEYVTVKATDLQGPLNNAGLILDYTELAVAIYEAPELVDRFLATVASAQIELCRLQRRVVEEAGRPWCADWDMVWYPVGRNGYIAADDSLLMSPAMYKRFVAPHDSRVLNTVSGGGIMHNCGPILGSVEPFRSVENCIAITFDMAINWGQLPEICRALGPGGRFFTCGFIPGKDFFETIRYINRITREHGVGYSFYACFADAIQAAEAYRFWREEC